MLVLDGSPEHGMASRHVASGVEIRYAGRFTADEVIARLVEYEFAASSPGTLVVTDDIELTGIVRRSGGRTTRNGWLLDRLDRQRLSAPSIGRPRAQRRNRPNEPPRGSSDRQPNPPNQPSGLSGPRGSSERQPNPPNQPSGLSGPPPSIGRSNPPGRVAGFGAGPGPSPDDTTADERPRWSPGRGATRKRGNGRRKPASGR
jgi:hypothetical protein